MSTDQSSTLDAPFTYFDPALGMEMVGDIQSLDELLALAEVGLNRDLPAIDECLRRGDARTAGAMLHAIKGFAPIFCVPVLVEHVTRVEHLGKTASAAELALPYAELAPRLRQLRDEIATYRQSRPLA